MSYFESKALREQRAEIAAQMQSISRAAKSEERVFTAEETQRFDQLDAVETELRAKIESAERVEKSAALAEIAFSTPTSRATPAVRNGRKATQRDRELALRGWLFGHSKHSKPEYVEAAQRMGLDLSTHEIEVRQQSLSDTEGGHTVENDTLVPQIVERLQALSDMRQVATVVQRATGESHAWPVVSDIANSAAIHTELTDISNVSVAFTNITIANYIRESGVFPVSYELLQDSQVNLESYFADLLAKRIARKEGASFTTGGGSGDSHGIVNESTLGVTCASTSVITWEEVQDLEHSVDPAYRQGASFMCHDSTFKKLKRVEDSNGNLLWQPNINVRAADTFDGYPIKINQSMATIAAQAKVLLFGDLSKYLIQDIGGLQIRVLRELYALKLGVGLIAYRRSGGRLLDPFAVYHLKMAVS